MSSRTFVIVGASLAGLRAAETLRTEGFDGRIVLVGEEPHHPYDRPPLSKGVLTGAATAESTQFRDAAFYADQQIDLVLGRRVTALDAGDASVMLDDGTVIGADAVMLCTGGRPRRVDLPGANLPGVHVLRTLDDSLSIAAGLQPGASLVVVGGGFIGLEVAAAARQLGCDVTVLELDDVLLRRALAPELSGRLVAEHRNRGVKIVTGVQIDGFEGVDDRVTAVTTVDGTRYPADLVVVGVGMIPNTELAAEAGLHVDNGIVVDGAGRTANPAVFAAGDVTNHPSPWLGRRVRHEHWQGAADQGSAMAGAALGKPETTPSVPWFWSDQYDLNLQVAGHPDPLDEVVWRGSVDDASFCAFYLHDGVLNGAVAINRPKEVRSVMQLINGGHAVTREQLADESVDLRKVASGKV